MKNINVMISMAAVITAAMLFGCGGSTEPEPQEPAELFFLEPTSVLHGDIEITPAARRGEQFPQGTEFSVIAQADSGYVLDSVFTITSGAYGDTYTESMSGDIDFVLNENTKVGALFLPEEELSGLQVTQDVVYAQPGVKALKYDVFAPEDAEDLPMVIIVHGGGWRSNDENIMRGMAREIALTGRYVVASIDYRWIGNLDAEYFGADATEDNQVQDLIADVYGAIAHFLERADVYGGDPTRVAITGDSAGGHLSASAATMVERIGDGGWTAPNYEILPTYLPEGMNAAEFRQTLLDGLKVAAPSYGVFGGTVLENAVGTGTESWAISPISNIPAVDERSIPHFMVRGTSDPIISLETVSSYADALQTAGQDVIHIEVEGAGHAFYDWKPDATTRRTFETIGVPHIHQMLEFFDSYL